MKIKIILFLFSAITVFTGCRRYPEMTLEEIEDYKQKSSQRLIENTKFKPWINEPIAPGKTGGFWYTTISADPKTFNQYIGERDGSSAGIISHTLDYLVDYDTETREWYSKAATFEIETDTANNTLTVHYTIKENLVWSWFGKSETVPVTSDDIVFWYNEIAGDSAFQSSGYGGQFVTMENGESRRIECIKIDERRFDFIFPRIIADPLLHTNMEFCPSFIYKKAKEEKGIEGVKDIFNASCNVKEIPSMGKWYIEEYSPSQRIVFARNPFYWEKDSKGVSIPYPEKKIVQIVGNESTDYLLFKEGKQEIYSPRPEELDSVVANQGKSYSVFRADGAMGAPLWSFNQNPKNKDSLYYNWFTKKEFRQAMSCLLNRDRIINQSYRGMAEAKLNFFPSANPYYNEDIKLKYVFNREKAVELLNKINFRQDSSGIMRDDKGNEISFDLSIVSSNALTNDIAQIISDECSKIGITVNIRQTDFQKLVEMLTSTYDWQSLIIGLGSNLFPSQGSNVWPSSGNLHLWYPEQTSPATDWEKRIDYLYNEGCYTNNKTKAKEIWDEYQELILEQCPVIYLVCSKSFTAIQNKWHLENFYYDNLNGAITDYLYLE